MISALEGGGWSAPRPGRFTSGKDSVPIVQGAEWAPGPVWTCAKNLAPTGTRSPERPARSQSLYRLSYPAHKHLYIFHLISFNELTFIYDSLFRKSWTDAIIKYTHNLLIFYFPFHSLSFQIISNGTVFLPLLEASLELKFTIAFRTVSNIILILGTV
jgi:hypothetical protein